MLAETLSDFGDMDSKAEKPPTNSQILRLMAGLPARLQRAMELRDDMTQVQLARISGVAQATISNLVSGKSLAGVTAAVIVRLAVALRTSAGFLLLGERDELPIAIRKAETGVLYMFRQHEHPAEAPDSETSPEPSAPAHAAPSAAPPRFPLPPRGPSAKPRGRKKPSR